MAVRIFMTAKTERAANRKVNCVHSQWRTEPRDVVMPCAFGESFYQNLTMNSIPRTDNRYSQIKLS